MPRLILAGLIGSVFGALILYGLLQLAPPAPIGPATVPADASIGHPTDARAAVTTSYAEAVSRATGSVVNIYTNKIATEKKALVYKDPVLQHHFGQLLPEQTRERIDTSLGSGVVVRKDGLILTNMHILDQADEIKVVLADGSNVKVDFVGKDPATDLAILKMAPGKAPAIPIGRSDELRVGDVTLAIGNPFGVGQTVTMGIVSALGRSHLGISDFENFIQTDAAINPGNSGGALINDRGELVGINTAIFSNSGGSHGIGFAIPASVAIVTLDQIMQRGHVQRGWIGITAREVTATIKESFGLTTDTGVMVSGLLEDGPAQSAGLRPGDVITHIDNRSLRGIQDLLGSIANAGPGSELHFSCLRGSQRLDLPVLTAERPSIPRR